MTITRVPGLFIVPVMTTSPRLAKRCATTPAIGERMTVFARASLADCSPASASMSSCLRISQAARAPMRTAR